ncbi:hypothetical protein AAWM_07511 [Aspergillus awamori]|uniref:Uncharacterized protein n=1 Tax=Aspergillus awamori TaxID=105351 RepID=A0A401KZ95_ASPAW|nr:hypothetical protein AAWM_07511 [Aspergillus awamori]
MVNAQFGISAGYLDYPSSKSVTINSSPHIETPSDQLGLFLKPVLMLQKIAHNLEDEWTDEDPVNAVFIELLNGSGFFLLLDNEDILLTNVGQTIFTF